MAGGPPPWQPRRMSANMLKTLKRIRAVACFESGGTTKEECMPATETELMLKGYGLTTAEIFYRMPDYRNVLNTFVWQDYDLAPDYPQLFRFIEFWQDKIEGPLHSVRFTHRKLISPGEWRHVKGEFRLH
jgi:uncharacterized protein Usg